MDHREIAPAPPGGVLDTPWRLAAVVGLLVFLSRLPFLGHGYGSDADGWRAMLAAQHFLSSGHYVPSRPPGYPIPEFFDALMLWLGLGDSWWVSLGTALMSGLTAFWLLPAFLPLGREKALPLSLAFAFTPVVFVASLGAMDYLWASAFFLAATWCAWRGRLLGTAVLLGLAAACRPTYALGYIPLALMLIDLRLSSLRTRETWRTLIVLAGVSGGLTLAFFVPALMEIGATVFKMPPQHPPSLQQLVFIPTVGVFGLLGLLAIGLLALAALRGSSEVRVVPVAPDAARAQRLLAVWSWCLIVGYTVLFLRLPDEPAYLLPVLLGALFLLARRVSALALWLLLAAMVVSSFWGSLARRPDGGIRVDWRGPVLREVQVEDRRACISEVVRQHMARVPADHYLVTAEYRPQLRWEVGPRHADHILYLLAQVRDGVGLRDTEGVSFGDAKAFWILDRATVTQEAEWHPPEGLLRVLDTRQACPD